MSISTLFFTRLHVKTALFGSFYLFCLFFFFFPVCVEISLKPKKRDLYHSCITAWEKQFLVSCALPCTYSIKLQYGALKSKAKHARLSPIMMGQGIDALKKNSLFFLVYRAAKQIVTSALGMFHGRLICDLRDMQIPTTLQSMSSRGTRKSCWIVQEGLLAQTVAR